MVVEESKVLLQGGEEQNGTSVIYYAFQLVIIGVDIPRKGLLDYLALECSNTTKGMWQQTSFITMRIQLMQLFKNNTEAETNPEIQLSGIVKIRIMLFFQYVLNANELRD